MAARDGVRRALSPDRSYLREADCICGGRRDPGVGTREVAGCDGNWLPAIPQGCERDTEAIARRRPPPEGPRRRVHVHLADPRREASLSWMFIPVRSLRGAALQVIVCDRRR